MERTFTSMLRRSKQQLQLASSDRNDNDQQRIVSRQGGTYTNLEPQSTTKRRKFSEESSMDLHLISLDCQDETADTLQRLLQMSACSSTPSSSIEGLSVFSPLDMHCNIPFPQLSSSESVHNEGSSAKSSTPQYSCNSGLHSSSGIIQECLKPPHDTAGKKSRTMKNLDWPWVLQDCIKDSVATPVRRTITDEPSTLAAADKNCSRSIGEKSSATFQKSSSTILARSILRECSITPRKKKPTSVFPTSPLVEFRGRSDPVVTLKSPAPNNFYRKSPINNFDVQSPYLSTDDLASSEGCSSSPKPAIIRNRQLQKFPSTFCGGCKEIILPECSFLTTKTLSGSASSSSSLTSRRNNSFLESYPPHYAKEQFISEPVRKEHPSKILPSYPRGIASSERCLKPTTDISRILQGIERAQPLGTTTETTRSSSSSGVRGAAAASTTETPRLLLSDTLAQDLAVSRQYRGPTIPGLLFLRDIGQSSRSLEKYSNDSAASGVGYSITRGRQQPTFLSDGECNLIKGVGRRTPESSLIARIAQQHARTITPVLNDPVRYHDPACCTSPFKRRVNTGATPATPTPVSWRERDVSRRSSTPQLSTDNSRNCVIPRSSTKPAGSGTPVTGRRSVTRLLERSATATALKMKSVVTWNGRSKKKSSVVPQT